jgi:hypothetical protein
MKKEVKYLEKMSTARVQEREREREKAQRKRAVGAV